MRRTLLLVGDVVKDIEAVRKSFFSRLHLRSGWWASARRRRQRDELRTLVGSVGKLRLSESKVNES